MRAPFPACRSWTSTAQESVRQAGARRDLGWLPRHDFRFVLDRLAAGEDPRGPLAVSIGHKGYHAVTTGPYTTR